MTRFTDRLLDPDQPTVHVHVRETPSGSFKLRLMSINKPASQAGRFRSAKSDT